MGARVVRKYGKGKGFACRFGGRGRPRAASAVRSAGYRRKRCSAGRAADRAKRERAAPPPGQAAKKAALSLPSGGTNGCRKSGARHRWQDGWVKKEVRPGGRKMWKREGTARRFAWAGTGARHPFPGRRGKEGQKGTAALRAAPPLENPVESRLGRAPREAPPRRHWKNPRGKPASDEPLSDLGKARRRPPRTSPSGSTASAALEKPAESRLGRAHRQASPRRPCKTPQKAASDEPIGKHRLGGPAKPRRKPPRTSPTGSIAAAALQNPVEGRFRRALRQALFRRPCAVSLAGRQGKGRSTTRARGENVEKGRDCPPVRMGGNGRAASDGGRLGKGRSTTRARGENGKCGKG